MTVENISWSICMKECCLLWRGSNPRPGLQSDAHPTEPPRPAPKAGNSELWFLCFAHRIMLIYIYIKFQENISVFKLQSGHKYITEITIFKVQRAIIQNSRLTSLVLEFCTSSHDALHFIKISGRAFNLQSGQEYIVEMAILNIYYVQRALTPKVGKPELLFLGSACCLMVLYIFYNNISKVFNLQSRHEYITEMAMFKGQ